MSREDERRRSCCRVQARDCFLAVCRHVCANTLRKSGSSMQVMHEDPSAIGNGDSKAMSSRDAAMLTCSSRRSRAVDNYALSEVETLAVIILLFGRCEPRTIDQRLALPPSMHVKAAPTKLWPMLRNCFLSENMTCRIVTRITLLRA